MVREGVTNIVRHAHASHCRVVLSADSIEVADDGIGLNSTGTGERVASASIAASSPRPASTASGRRASSRCSAAG